MDVTKGSVRLAPPFVCVKFTLQRRRMILRNGALDSWDLGTGAIDDGSGVVTAMETIQLLQSLHLRPRRTIRFVAWMNGR